MYECKPLNFYQLRTSFFDYSDYTNLCEHALISKEKIFYIFFNNSIFREMILSSSPDLYDSIVSKKGNREDQASSLLKFLLRSCSRATPYGLYAGTSVVFTKSAKQHDNFTFVKKVDFDAEWVSEFTNQLEKNLDCILPLKARLNKNLIITTQRVFNPYISQLNNKKIAGINKTSSIGIKKTKVIDFIFKLVEEDLTLREIFNSVRMNSGNNIPPLKILDILYKLVNYEFIYSEIRPSADTTNYSNHLYTVLQKDYVTRIYFEKVKALKSMINNYEKLPIGKGEKLLKSIHFAMKKMFDSKNPLKIDLKINSGQIDLDVQDVISPSFISFFVELTACIKEPSSLINYRNKFIEKYGFDRYVPLTEIIEKDTGIGFPEYEESDTNLVLNTYLENEIQLAVMQKKNEVSFTTEKLKKSTTGIPKDYPKSHSFELAFAQDGDLEILPNIGSVHVAKYAGRFLYLEKEEVIKKISNQIHLSENNDNSCIFDVSINHINSKANNIQSKHQFHSRKLSLGYANGNNPEICLADLAVGIEDNRICLFNISDGKKAIFESGSMINPNICPDLYRMLFLLSNDKNIVYGVSHLRHIGEKFLYCPQLKVDGITILKEKWTLQFDSFKEKNKREMLKQLKKMNVPRFVHLQEIDNRLLIDLENPDHFQIINSELEHKNHITLFAATDPELSKQKRPIEFVIPFQFKQSTDEIQHLSRTKTINKVAQSVAIDTKERYKNLFSEWVYLKIYGTKDELSEINLSIMRPLTKKLLENKTITKFHFVNFSDEIGTHLRFRFKLTNLDCYKELLSYLKKISNTINKFNDTMIIFDVYDREIERYGGLNNIDSAETFFMQSTDLAYVILEDSDFQFTIDFKIAFSIIYIIEKFEIPPTILDSFFVNVNKKIFSKDFREFKNQFLKFFSKKNNWECTRSTPALTSLFNILDNQSGAYAKYSKDLLKQLATKVISEQEYSSIVQSQFHMFCNRVMGIDLISENRIYFYIKNILKAKKHYLDK
jgi:thiopeptide-type bacteriocin biosynthesis protein